MEMSMYVLRIFFCCQFLASAGPDVATLKFCSATYRLIKPERPLETATTQDPTVQVKYRGTYEYRILFVCCNANV